MSNDITVIEGKDWYGALVEDCRAIITEAIFNNRWALVEGYHALGERVVIDSEYKKWEQNKAGGVVQGLAKDIEISPRSLYYAMQFYEKYPNLQTVPEGKNITWNKIITKYLPEPKIDAESLPDGKYRVIYADPPWKYGNNMPDEYGEQGDHYQLLSIQEICAMPIKDMAEDNAVLFLWVTSPILEESFEVVRAWGFEYKTSFVWNKSKHVMGHYNSVRHEFLLVCVRGSCQPDVQKLFDSVYEEERTEHSHKPEHFRNVIDTIYPNGKRIELFARDKNDHWDTWGNEIP